MVLLKSLAEQEARHSEPLAGEKSVLISPARRAVHILTPDSGFLAPFNVAMPTSYTSSPQNYKSSPQKSQKIHGNYSKVCEKYSKMNAKYAEKPDPNPNEPIKANCGKLCVIHRTNPISKQKKP
jgi:ribosomal protein S17